MKIIQCTRAKCKQWGGHRALSPLFCFRFVNLNTLPLFFLFLLISGCLPAPADTDLRPYYSESCHLKEVGLDSLRRFDDKIQTLTRTGAMGPSDGLYDEILDNVQKHISTMLPSPSPSIPSGQIRYTLTSKPVYFGNAKS